ncbi:MAG: hypothetical protein AAB352_00130 [Patescibacteria group bacterium]
MVNQKKAKEAYELYLEKAKNDDRIIGVILAGGRGKGIATKNSDYDILFITTDDGLNNVIKNYPGTEYVDSLPHAISDFREYAKTGSATEWDKYSFTHISAVIDKTGEIQKLVEEKGSLMPDVAHKIARTALGGYLNSVHRSLKHIRDGKSLAAQLDAAESISNLLVFLFAVENRVCPFNKFLEWELKNYPLKNLPIKPSDFLKKILIIIKKSNPKIQKEILEIVKKVAIENGHSDEIKDWEGYYFG